MDAKWPATCTTPPAEGGTPEGGATLMAKTRAMGLLMLWCDVDPERADVPQSEAWNRVRDLNPWTHRVRPFS
jgi:hypothetical protein